MCPVLAPETQKKEQPKTKTSPVVREGMKGFCLYNDVVRTRTDLITKKRNCFKKFLPEMKEAKGAKNVLLFTSLSLFLALARCPIHRQNTQIQFDDLFPAGWLHIKDVDEGEK